MATTAPFHDNQRVMDMLSQIAVFGGLCSSQLRQIFALLQKTTYNAGEIVFRQDDPSECIYIIESGAVELSISNDTVVLEKAHLTTGACFGEASFIGIHRHSATARCETDCELIILSRAAFLRLQQDDLCLFSLLILNLARELARRLQLTDRILMHHYLQG